MKDSALLGASNATNLIMFPQIVFMTSPAPNKVSKTKLSKFHCKKVPEQLKIYTDTSHAALSD